MAKTHFLLHVILLILSSSLCLVFSTKLNFTTDQSSLLAIRDHIIPGPHHILAQNWSTTSSFCNWIGVKCGTRGVRVTALNLSSMGLRGTIPPNIGNLSFLSSLDLSFNNFQGHLPQEFSHLRRLKFISFTKNSFSGAISSWIGNFSKLESLVLAFNNFTSSIPEEIGNCRNLKNIMLHQNHLFGTIPSTIFNLFSLQYLDFSNNNLSGSLPHDMCQNLSNIEFLYFERNNLHGQLPSSIGECTNLQTIYFAKNKFVGGIPTSIGSLSKLKEIHSSHNSLNGFISPIFNISSLEMISLEQNSFSGVLPKDICHKLPMLRYLVIYENGFTGSIPKDFWNCSFVEFDISENYLTGDIPREIGNLHDLVYVNMCTNNLYGEIPHDLFNSSKLQYLSLSNNSLSGSLPSDFGFWLPNMEELHLCINNLSGRIPSSISNASKLITIELSYNSFSRVIPNTLGNLRQLENLNLLKNKLTAESTSSTDEWGFLSSLANCKQLKFLALSSNPLNGILPAAPFGNLSSIQQFYAHDCQLKGNIPTEVGNFSNMIRLVLYGNELIGSIPITIGRLQRLQGLDLHDNKLQGPIPHTLCNLQSLSELHLSENELSGPILPCISNLTSLRYLYLFSNNLSSTLPFSLWNLKDILTLYISSNQFHGSIPKEIQNLQALTLLNLSSNQFSGNIPTTLGSLLTLQYLSLGSNKLQGSIPDSFGSLLSLETLDLSNNMLLGVIPESLVKLTFLVSFNVSFNELEGRIPIEGPFKNFTTQSYLGNYGLCGSTYLNVSSCRQSSHHEHKGTIVLVLKFVLPPIAATILIVLLIIVVMRRKHLRKTDSPNNGESLLTKVTWRMVSYHELFNATNGFNDDMLLGVGSFGSVYKGSLSNGMIVAVKVFKLQPEDRVLTSFEVECEVMRNIRHRNLVQIITACDGMDFKALVLQFMPNGSLDKWLHSDNHYLDMKQRIDIMIDVASALDYIHNWSPQPVAHCDLKPNNVLLDKDMIAHVADFGIAKLLNESDHVTHTITLATFGYMAPEYGIQGNVSTRGDVYSYGILLLEVITRKRPTDSMFDGEMSLKLWVCQSLPDDIYKVVDSDLFRTNEEQVICATRDCALSILELALNCCTELPGQRKEMGEVINNLKKIKEKYMRDVEVTRPSMVTLRKN